MEHVEVSKFLSYVLRHKPQAIGISLDQEGWALIDELIEGAVSHGKVLDRELIRHVVEANDKKRFSISEDGLRIRAVQGHSTTDVDLAYTQKIPPNILYHGTAMRFLHAILEEGLKPGERHYVHLSGDAEAAATIGRRHGRPIVLEIQALRMHEQGFAFFQAKNGVWLTRQVPRVFIEKLA